MLLYRSWVTDAPLQVVGPAPVVDAWRALDPPRRRPGDATDARQGQPRAERRFRRRVTVLAARHAQPGEAVLYAVERGGRRLLYATDTGPLRAADLEPLRGRASDLVLLEGRVGDRAVEADDHLDLAGFGRTVEVMRRLGVVTSASRRRGDPPRPPQPAGVELAVRLAALLRARAVADGTVVAAPVPDPGGDDREGPGAPLPLRRPVPDSSAPEGSPAGIGSSSRTRAPPPGWFIAAASPP